VDAVVNTIGFPLVGGPAGSMAAGRRVDVAAEILESMDVPYLVAAPLLIQDDASWRRDGVQGLQQVSQPCRNHTGPHLWRHTYGTLMGPHETPPTPMGPPQVVLYALPELDGAVDTVVS